MMGDKAYDAKSIREFLRDKGILDIIPVRKCGFRKQEDVCPHFDKQLYKERNIVERLIGWIKNCRRIATRYEKRARAFLAMIKVAFIHLYLKKYL